MNLRPCLQQNSWLWALILSITSQWSCDYRVVISVQDWKDKSLLGSDYIASAPLALPTIKCTWARHLIPMQLQQSWSVAVLQLWLSSAISQSTFEIQTRPVAAAAWDHLALIFCRMSEQCYSIEFFFFWYLTLQREKEVSIWPQL